MWDRLIEDIEPLILQALVRQLATRLILGNKRAREAIYWAREINWSFHRAVGHLWRLFTPMIWVEAPKADFAHTSRWVMRVDAVPSFVEGVMRYHCDTLVDKRYPISTETNSYLYERVYTACTTRQSDRMPITRTLNASYYHALCTVGRALVVNGTLRRLQGVYQRDRWRMLVLHTFKFLDRCYVPTHYLRDVHTILCDIFSEAEPDTHAA